MPKPPNIIPPTRLEFRLPEDLRARLDLTLYSDLEQRVPHGAYAKFFAARIREHFEWSTLDLAPLGFPTGFFVRGPKDMIEHLRLTLESKQ